MPKTPSFILKKIEECRATQAKSLDLRGGDDFGEIRLIAIPPEVFTLSHLESLDLRDNAIQVVPDEIKQLTQLKRLDLRGNPLWQVADVAGLFVHYADFVKLNLPPKNIIGLKLTLFSHDAPEHIFELPNLTALEISNHRLTQIPDWVLKLEKLTELDFSDNNLRELSGIEKLVNLSSLNLRNNQLTNLSGIEALVNLSSLNLTNNHCNNLFKLEKLVNLTSLNLSFNGLYDLSELKTLVNLSFLDLSFNQLAHLAGLEILTNLHSLNLSNNPLQRLSELGELVNLSNLDLSALKLESLSKLEIPITLSSLNLGSNRLEDLSGLERIFNLSSLDLGSVKLKNLSGLDKLKNLTSLCLTHNWLESLAELGTLTNLSSLDISYNPLKNFVGLEQLVNLSILDLSGYKLKEIPIESSLNVSLLKLSSNQITQIKNIGKLTNLSSLSSLDLRNNRLSSLSGIETLLDLFSLYLGSNCLSGPSGIETLFNLSSLDLSFNQLSSLSGIETLVNLSSLDISHNQLSNLSGIETLLNLSSLDLSHNQLSNLSEIETLLNLSSLDLRDNKFLQIIPNKLLSLSKLEVFQLDETITYPPIEQLELEGGYGEANLFRVRNYLRQLAEEKDYLYEAKLLIVGEGEAGKTSLMRKIQNPAYELPETQIESTEGIDVEPWSFAFDEQHQFRVNIWDFGGQSIYHATHQFFLSKRALYILVADNRKEDTDFYYWLNVVNTLSDGSPVLVVKNEKGDRSREINESALRGQFQNFKESYATNLKTNSKDYYRLLDDIRHRLKQLPLVGSPQPKKWLDVRAELEQRAEQDNYIDLKEYYAICERHGFKHEGDKRQLSNTLHDLGTILHFQEDALLNKTLFLKPEWATQAVYHVLDNPLVRNNYGQFTSHDLSKIWHEAHYDQLMYGELLQLMLNFKLCYQLTHCKNTYIAPQLLREQQPQYTLETTDAVTVFYKNYKFMPKGMLSQLIVVLHKDIAECQKLVWRSGVVLERHNTRAEIIENYSAREIRIRVVGQHRRDLLTEVMYELNKIHDSYHNLKYEVLLPCNCEDYKDDPKYFEYGELQDFSANNQPKQCGKCFNMLDANKLIEGVLNVKDDNNGKTGFGGNRFGDIHGDVIVQQAGHDAVFNQTHSTLNQGIQTDIDNLRKLLSGLPLSEEEKSKVEKLVNTLATEAKKPAPDTEEASSALERIFKLIEKTGKLSEAIKTQLVPIGKNLGEWLGEDGKTLMAFLSTMLLGM